METYFVNEAFNKAVNDYLISKDTPEGILYNSFLVVVTRILINIYGELDIINPYQTKNEAALDTNLAKYGASTHEINNLKRLIDGYYKIELKNNKVIKKEENSYFIEVQKCLIDLFTLKRMNFGVTENEQKDFFDLLYTPGTSNFYRISINYKYTDDSYEIAEYYKKSLEKKGKIIKKEDKELMPFDAYKLFNISIAELSKMNNEELEKVNKEIYKSLDINENAMNKEFLLSEKIKEIMYPNELITTGNGYVDILLVMSVIVTTIMVVVIFGTIVF